MHLRSLDLSRCDLGSAGCAALAAALRAQAGTTAGPLRLVLGPGDGIEDADVAVLADALAARGGDRQQEQQAEAAAPAVEYDLDLSGADLGPTGVRALARLPGLVRLVLFGSSLLADTVSALCGAIGGDAGGSGGGEGGSSGGGSGFAALRELNLAGCRLGVGSLKQLLVALERAGDGSALRLVEVRAPGARGAAWQG